MTVDQLVYGYLANEESYADKSVIIEEGSTGNWVYVILEGKVNVKKKAADGLIIIDTLKAGDIFGEMAMFGQKGGIRTASVVALGPVRVGVLDTERLVRDYESISPQLRDLMKSLIKRLKDTNNKVIALAVRSSS